MYISPETTRYSPVAPLKVLQELRHRDALGNYLLLLAHEILENPQGFRELLEGMSVRFVILDNSVVEKGAALPARYLAAAAEVVQANCIVLPDVMGDAENTVRASHQAAASLRQMGFSSFMAVPQGQNIPQLAWCTQHLSLISGVKYWGLARWITVKLGSRQLMSTHLGLGTTGVEGPRVHLLGMSQSITDDLQCTQYRGIMGIDSANPLVLAAAGRNISDADTYEHLDRRPFWDDMEVNDLMLHNIAKLRSAINDPHQPRAPMNMPA